MTEQAEPATELELAVELDEIGVDAPRVAIIMGSKSDMDVMDGAANLSSSPSTAPTPASAGCA